MSHRVSAGLARGWVWIFSFALLAAVGCDGNRLPAEPDLEGGFAAEAAADEAAGDDWIVVFHPRTADPEGLARRLVAAHGGSVRHTYGHALRGFAAQLPPQAVEAIASNPNVAYVDRDGTVRRTEVGSWGLDRIDQRDLPLDAVYDPGPGRDGTDVTAYIIDTGIDMSLLEFGGRASSGYDFVDDDPDASDCDGHGTHVAGTVGSETYGVAKNVSLVAVRVLNCQGSGTFSGVIAGIDWVTANRSGKAVANMSLGGGYSQAVNEAVNNSVAAGVVYAVSSGNSNADACGYSPASAEAAITVNASTSSDQRSSFSNYGPCTDVFAPGSSIRSTIMGGGSQAWNGTSMASPHVAGVAALYLQDGLAAADVPAAIADRASRDRIGDAGPGSPNLLLYAGTQSGDPCATGGCPSAEVSWVSPVSVKINKGKIGNGTVTVEVSEVGGNPLVNVTVAGSWTVDGVPEYASASGVTGADGTVELSTGGIRHAAEFVFCVTGLSGSIVDATGYSADDPCSPYGTPPDGGGGGTEPGAAPANLSATKVAKGRNWRVELAWDSGAASVDVLRNGEIIAAAVNNSGSYADNFGKTPAPGDYVYRVCDAGSTTICSNDSDPIPF